MWQRHWDRGMHRGSTDWEGQYQTARNISDLTILGTCEEVIARHRQDNTLAITLPVRVASSMDSLTASALRLTLWHR